MQVRPTFAMVIAALLTLPISLPIDAHAAPLNCGKNYKLVKGQCVLKQNCGQNAYRSPEGDCYCSKYYEMKKGKCVWKQSKSGFEIAPWKKPGCTRWQSECAKGKASSCTKYETTCQVN